jgi:hypothetical protein
MRKPKTITPAPAKGAKPKPFIPPTVERIAAAVADILTYGGTPEDEEHIILAAVSQEYRGKSFRRAFKDVDERVRDGQKYSLPLMLKGLADFRIDRPKFEDEEEPAATAIVERIRQSSRELCAREFKDFLQDADAEEVRFLYAVLNWWSSKGKHNNELSIASAFLDEAESNAEIFRAPAKHAEAVDAYIDALMKTEPNGNTEEED